MNNRLLRIVYSREHSCVIASDVSGRICKFNRNLELIASSVATSYRSPINAICLSETTVFTKDRLGNVGQWDIETLKPLAFLDGYTLCDRSKLNSNEEVSPSPSRAIAIHNDKLYTTNGYAQIVVLDPSSLSVVDIRSSPSDTFIDCICVDNPDVHALSDFNGNIFLGNIETNRFETILNVDTNVVHSIIYDKKFNRFWTTQDGGIGDDRGRRTGVIRFEIDGSGLEEFKLSHEDNEFIASDETGEWIVSGGFNGVLSIFYNSQPGFSLQRSIGPLEFQIISGTVESKDRIYVLLQTGEVILLNSEGRELTRSSYVSNCAWIFQPHPLDQSQLYVGTDHGVALIEFCTTHFGGISTSQRWHHKHGLGICKDVRPLEDGSYVTISRNGYVFRVDRDGGIRWKRQVLGVPRSIALSPDHTKCLVSTDEGSAWEFNLDKCSICDVIPVGSPSYACIYLPDGRRVVSSDGDRAVIVYSADSHSVLGRIGGFEYRIKRMIKASNEIIYAIGPDGMFSLDFNAYCIDKKYGDYLVSTKENGVVSNDGYIYVGGYGYQLGSYRVSDGSIVDLQEDLQDFTKAFHLHSPANGKPILFVGGRGGFINIYRLIGGVPLKVKEIYLT